MSVASPPVVRAPRAALRDGTWRKGERALPEETPIAFVVDGAAEAVMLATPADLDDFALGFALSEGIIAAHEDLRELEIVGVLIPSKAPLPPWGEGRERGRAERSAAAPLAPYPARPLPLPPLPGAGETGVEVRLWLRERQSKTHVARRRTRAGPAGCGLCGVESLEAALPPCAPVDSDFTLEANAIVAAMAQLPQMQTLNRETHAVHAAAFFTPDEGVVCVREDVGRHNALDKLIGALARQGRDCSGGVILMTSRVSIELIQKAARARAPVLAAISAPTALALRTAEGAGICVCGIVRDNGLEVFTCSDRII